ncbi:MAG: cyclic nucleotide-binding domain-containing protein [Gammaproteobacteria bacterium]|nr:cyclic nucleotide-binding domain-containing protein [Gammaproteobacteria bacterium]
MRLLAETTQGMPVDRLYDFGAFRRLAVEVDGVRPFFGSAGMLAVRGPWRRKRFVIRAMCKMAAAVCRRVGVTHILVAVNHSTASMYRRFGFEALAEPYWVEQIGNHVVPLATTTETFLEWAFAGTSETPLHGFEDSFERVFVSAGERVFSQGERGRHAFVVESGGISIRCATPTGSEMTLTHLQRGDMFGELALLDNKPRSASAIAEADTELVSLDRESFSRQISEKPDIAMGLLRLLAGRLRQMDELFMVHAFSSDEQRLEFALGRARRHSTPDRRGEGRWVFNGGPAAIAASAKVDEEAAREFLEARSQSGELDFSNRRIRFSVMPN